ncbi:MAG: SLBB domain-containing protein [Gemmatimonadetes bacterium]|nr:SLBB domain-containing protein [Gemmatimonadota bacterium]
MRVLGPVVPFLLAIALPAHAQRSQVIPQGAAMAGASAGAVEAELRTRLEGSGLSADQIRSRLRLAGLPEGALDAVLGTGGAMRAGGGDGAADRQAMIDAVRSLGMLQEDDVARLRQLAGGRGDPPPRRPPVRDLEADSGTALFGHALFRTATSLFQPNTDGPVDEGYRVGPGDRLVLILTGGVEAAHTLDVTREGFVVIPQAGEVAVANLTLGEVVTLVRARLARVYQGVGTAPESVTRLTLSVARLRSTQVFVTGDVEAPGAYRIGGGGTMLSALYAAGGPADHGSLRRVELRRRGALAGTLDVYDYLLRGDASRDLRLQQGDVIHVPLHGPRVRITGAVTRPATYELAAGETLAELVRAAGGLRATAAGRRLLVERVVPLASRVNGRDRVALDVPLGDDGGVPGLPMADGDVVRVPEVADRVRGRITIAGHVWHPGPQGFAPGMTLADALRRAGGVQPDGYLPVVHVARLQGDSTRAQLRTALLDTTGATAAPFPLAEDDEVTVYSRTAFRPDRHVAIVGAVRQAGRYPWREGMTLRDLVLLAGGLEAAADLREAEVARQDEGRDGGAREAGPVAITVRVPLDSSYRFDRGAPPRGTELPLRPFDQVLILRDPAYQPLRSVTIAGEVAQPGTYVLRDRTERLSALVARAGGFTRFADPSAVYFARRVPAAADSQWARARASSAPESGGPRPGALDGPPVRPPARTAPRAMAGVMPGAATSSLAAVRGDSLADSTGWADSADTPRMRVGVDLARALAAPGSLQDLLLEDGDSVHIERLRQVVEVRGAVNRPSAQAYAGRASLGRYLRAAGGPSDRANARFAYVVQPDGRVETRRRLLGLFTFDPVPRAGAVVVVPERGERAGNDRFLASVSAVTQLLGTLITLAVVTR